MRAILIVVLLAASANTAHAGDGIPLAVDIGRTTERAVGNAHGWFCDDPSLVDASVVTRGELNVWVVKGVKAGATQCRVGTDVTRASYVYDVTVRPSRRSR